jgi:hypothetical protein
MIVSQPTQVTGLNPPSSRHWRTDCFAAVSLAFLLYVRLWAGLSFTVVHLGFFMKTLPGGVRCLAAAIDTLAVAALFLLGFRLVRRFRAYRLGLGAFAVAACVIASEASHFLRRVSLGSSMAPARQSWLWVGAAAAAVGLLVLWRGARRTLCMVYGVLLALSPVGALLLTQGAWGVLASRGSGFGDKIMAAPVRGPETGSGTLVWIVFDEWDYRLTFDRHPADVSLPELARLRAESFFATDARSPAANTLESIPSLLTGTAVEKSYPRGTSALDIRFKGERQPVDFSSYPNVFSRARTMGIDSAVVGWYLPYCRLLSRDICACSWLPMGQGYVVYDGGLISLIQQEGLGPLTFEDVTATRGRYYAAGLAASLQKEALRFVRSPPATLLFIHLVGGHGPYFFSRASSGVYSGGNKPSLYFDALSLIDRSIGQIRKELEAAGRWDSTSLILSTDHPMRGLVDGKKDPRIPFIVKLAGCAEPVTWHRQFNTVVTADLVLAILHQDIRTHEQIAAWLNSHGNQL